MGVPGILLRVRVCLCLVSAVVNMWVAAMSSHWAFPRSPGQSVWWVSLPLGTPPGRKHGKQVYRAALNDANGLRAVKRDGFMSDDSIKHGCSAIDEILGFIYRRP